MSNFTSPFMAKSPLRNDSKCSSLRSQLEAQKAKLAKIKSKCSSLRSQLEAQKAKLAKIKSECKGSISCQGEKGIDTVQETISVLNEQIASNNCKK